MERDFLREVSYTLRKKKREYLAYEIPCWISEWSNAEPSNELSCFGVLQIFAAVPYRLQDAFPLHNPSQILAMS